MKTTPKISVIVPIYNVEKYLNQCIESIIKQSFTDFELILVDDGSPDNCPQICDEWAKKDNRIKVIHKVNNGVAEARKTGVDDSKGKYIVFVDSDDWVENNYLEILYNKIIESDADIVQCNYRIVCDNKYENVIFCPYTYDKVAINSVLIKDCLNDRMNVFTPSMWNKIFKNNIINHALEIGKSNLSIGEDYLVIFSALCISNLVVISDTPCLDNYRYNIDSVTKNYNSKLKYETEVFFQHITKIADKFNIAAMDYSLKIIYVNMLYI